jgi:hypothetical protein
MIQHKTFVASHFFGSHGSFERKIEALRGQAEAFMKAELDEEDVVTITESQNTYISSVTVWYRGGARAGQG